MSATRRAGEGRPGRPPRGKPPRREEPLPQAVRALGRRLFRALVSLRRRPILQSLRNKLALLLFATIAGSFLTIFFYVVPGLGANLEQQKLRGLRAAAVKSSGEFESVMGRDIPARDLDRLVRAVADETDAQVTLLGVQRSAAPEPPGRAGIHFYVISDSRAVPPVNENDRLAARAIAGDRLETGVSTGPEGPMAVAARPLYYRGIADWVVVYSQSLADVTGPVNLIRGEVLLAGAVALVVALAGGYLIAGALARRVDRLEAAAKKVAAGEFVEPLPVDSDDELGHLTRTFNDMQEQLARVDHARREFIANASHELRTPIFSLGGFVELLQDEDLDPKTREEFLTGMREQVARLQKLSVDLLDLSRLDAGSLEINPEEVDLAELAQSVVGEFTPVVTRHRTDLDLRLARAGVEARCDRERVAQIMRILIDNALRHTPEGTRVIVSADRRDGAAEFTVADFGPARTGRHLDARSADQVFERFYTADAASGSGLGLAIARELAERMRGEVVLRSSSMETAFTLALPSATDGWAE